MVLWRAPTELLGALSLADLSAVDGSGVAESIQGRA